MVKDTNLRWPKGIKWVKPDEDIPSGPHSQVIFVTKTETRDGYDYSTYVGDGRQGPITIIKKLGKNADE